jgi:hypothetical protein
VLALVMDRGLGRNSEVNWVHGMGDLLALVWAQELVDELGHVLVVL